MFVPMKVLFVGRDWKFDAVCVFNQAGLARTLDEAEHDDRVSRVVVEYVPGRDEEAQAA